MLLRAADAITMPFRAFGCRRFDTFAANGGSDNACML